MGMAMGADNLIAIFKEEYYTHLSGGILEAFGKLFYRDIKIYLYPMRDRDTGQIITSNNIQVPPRMKELYKFMAEFKGDVPGATAIECGNYLDQNLPMANFEAKKYLDASMIEAFEESGSNTQSQDQGKTSDQDDNLESKEE